MEAVQTVEQSPAEEIWAILRENARELEKMRKRQEKDTREMKESAKRLDRQIGKLGGRFGEMVEYMVVPNLFKKFRKLGFIFDKAHQQTVIEDRENNIFTEVDITLENGDRVMIVEVKTKPTTEDITWHIERMNKLRLHADLKGDKRKFLGAVAGMIFNDNERQFALKNGFYVIEPSGENFNITPPGKPKEW